jgi:hypothetical protein
VCVCVCAVSAFSRQIQKNGKLIVLIIHPSPSVLEFDINVCRSGVYLAE